MSQAQKTIITEQTKLEIQPFTETVYRTLSLNKMGDAYSEPCCCYRPTKLKHLPLTPHQAKTQRRASSDY